MSKSIETNSGIKLRTGMMQNELGIIGEISENITSILDADGKELIANSQTHFNECFNSFITELDNISNGLRYNYELTSYRNCLSVSADKMPAALRKLYKQYPNFKLAHTRLLTSMKTLGLDDLLQTRLYNEYILDVLYEFIGFDYSGQFDKKGYELVNIDNFGASYNFDKVKFMNLYSGIKALNLYEHDFSLINAKGLDEIFKNFTNLELIELGNFKLAKLTTNQLRAFFKNLHTVKDIDYMDIIFTDLSPQTLNIIFSNLISLKILSLKGCSIGKLSKEQLSSIVSNIKLVKYLDLSSNALGLVDNELLDFIFSNLNNVKYFHLGNNRLELLNDEGLDMLFEHIKNARTLDFSGNGFPIFSDDKLKRFFLVNSSEGKQ